MKRIVPIIVTDDRVAGVHVWPVVTLDDGVQFFCNRQEVLVPSDDQLTRDLEGAITACEALAEQHVADLDFVGAGEAREIATRLRAAFHLDEDDQDA